MFPAEYFNDLSEALLFGLKHSQINPCLRGTLLTWWEVEKELIEEKIYKPKYE